jgi:hypothetical protein
MSYLQIEIGGQQRGLKFNQLAIELMSMYNDNTTSMAFFYAVVFGGLKGNAYVKREEFNHTFEEVTDWVDALPNKAETIGAITKTLNETQVWQDLIKQGKEIEEKKKA